MWNPKKANLRQALGALAQDLLNGIALVNGLLLAAARDAAFASIEALRASVVLEVGDLVDRAETVSGFLYDNLPAIEATADNIAEVVIAASNMPSILEVNANAANINTVAGISDDVSNVALIRAAISLHANNMPLIVAAAPNAIRAEIARDVAAGYASVVASYGPAPLFATVLGFSAITVPAGTQSASLWGYTKMATAGTDTSPRRCRAHSPWKEAVGRSVHSNRWLCRACDQRRLVGDRG